eukprot:2801224-Prymnesium_polylepis.1
MKKISARNANMHAASTFVRQRLLEMMRTLALIPLSVKPSSRSFKFAPAVFLFFVPQFGRPGALVCACTAAAEPPLLPACYA